MHQVVVLPEWNGRALIDVLSIAFKISKKRAKELLDKKNVFVNNRRCWIAKNQVAKGDTIEISGAIERKKSQKNQRKIQILYEDEFFLIANKPPGLNTNEGASIQSILRNQLGNQKLLAVHRLDKDTSGAIIVAKSQDVFNEFVKLFSGRKLDKIYHGYVLGVQGRVKSIINDSLDGKEAITHLSVLKSIGEITLMQIKIETGRTHQIRRHLKMYGMAILGDKEYGTKLSEARKYRSFDRQMLHAYSLSFNHPITGKKIKVTAEYIDMELSNG